MVEQDLPVSLKRWFVIHFIVDTVFAIPLIAAPETFLSFWGLQPCGNLTARLTGAALAAIGLNSFLMSRRGKDEYNSMLNLKIIWSSAAIAGISLTIAEEGSPALYLFLLIFIIFSSIWIYYKIRLIR